MGAASGSSRGPARSALPIGPRRGAPWGHRQHCAVLRRYFLWQVWVAHASWEALRAERLRSVL
eukprot:12765914-Alexandrium_andersonii.AAC.1